MKILLIFDIIDSIIAKKYSLCWLHLGYVLTNIHKIGPILGCINIVSVAPILRRNILTFHYQYFQYKTKISSVLAIHCKYLQCNANI